MLLSRLERWLRVSAGLGVLLLLVAQEKVWPWALRGLPLEQPAVDQQQPLVPQTLATSAADVADTSAPTDEEQKDQPVCLPYMVPDACAPRWPTTCHPFETRQSIGTRDGVVSCGSRHPGERAGVDTLPLAIIPDWRVLQRPAVRFVMVCERLSEAGGFDPAIFTALRRLASPVA